MDETVARQRRFAGEGGGNDAQAVMPAAPGASVSGVEGGFIDDFDRLRRKRSQALAQQRLRLRGCRCVEGDAHAGKALRKGLTVTFA